MKGASITRSSLNIIIVITYYCVFGACVASSDDQMQSPDCYVEIHSSGDTLSYRLYSFYECESYLAAGFILMKVELASEEWDGLWSHGQFEYCTTEYFLASLDGDSVFEVFTLFHDDTNTWGYVHRLSSSPTGMMVLQTLSIPYVVTDVGRFGAEFIQNEDESYTFLGTPYFPYRNPLEIQDTSVTVYYDTAGDSLALKIN